MKETGLASLEEALVIFKPTEIVKIAISDVSAPVNTAVELSKLAAIEKKIVVDMLKNTTRDKESQQLIMHPDALAWARELRMTLKEVHELTAGVQEKVMMKKIDVVGELYKKVIKENKPEEIIKLIKSMENGN